MTLKDIDIQPPESQAYHLPIGHRPQNENDEFVFDPPISMWDHIDIAMMRDRYSWVRPYSLPQGRKIQLGAGRKLIDRWENFEYPTWDADCYIPAELCNGVYKLSDPIDELNRAYIAGDNSVSEIASYHTLDHLRPDQVVNVLKEVQRVLTPGGIFTNIVPHYTSQLANECIMHKSRFAVDTWRNIFSERQYKNSVEGQEHEWKLTVMSNFIFGYTERNLVLVTQFMKEA